MRTRRTWSNSNESPRSRSAAGTRLLRSERLRNVKDPNSKLQRKTNFQLPMTVLGNCFGFRVLNFGFLAGLVIGHWIFPAASLSAAEPTPAQLEYFENNVRPLLVERCYKCHSAKSENLKGGLRLDSAEGVMKGGETGPVVAP